MGKAVDIGGPVDTGGGDIVGGNKIVKGLDVDELVDVLRRALGRDDPRPEELSQALASIQAYHTALYEWKELHNCLDEIINAFGQYYSQIERSNAEKRVVDMDSLRMLWHPVSSRVDELLDFAATIKTIGQPYAVMPDHAMAGEKWAVEINSLRRAINGRLHMSTDESPANPTAEPLMVKLTQPVQGLFGIRPGWWTELYELTHTFNDAATRHMHLADKKLRDTASALYNLSTTRLGGGNA
jgi:hypothetical protein